MLEAAVGTHHRVLTTARNTRRIDFASADIDKIVFFNGTDLPRKLLAKDCYLDINSPLGHGAHNDVVTLDPADLVALLPVLDLELTDCIELVVQRLLQSREVPLEESIQGPKGCSNRVRS